MNSFLGNYRRVVNSVAFIEACLGSPVKKDISPKISPLDKVFIIVDFSSFLSVI